MSNITIEQPLKDELNENIEYLKTQLLNIRTEDLNYSLFTGKTGLMMSFFITGKILKNEKLVSTAEKLLLDIVTKIHEVPFISTFCNGLAGIAWCINWLNTNGYFQHDAEQMVLNLEQNLTEYLINQTSNNKDCSIDFLHGISGIVYFLCKRNKKENSIAIQSFVNLLIENAIDYKESHYWINTTLEDKNKINFGLAHGIPSFVIILLEIQKSNNSNQDLKDTIYKAMKFFDYFESTSTQSLYPSYLNNEYCGSYKSRVGWCYGDIGIGLMFYKVGSYFADKVSKQKGIDILKRTAKRTDLKDTGVVDISICHGSIGLTQIYKKLYVETSDSTFLDASKYWLKFTFNHEINLPGSEVYKSSYYEGKYIDDYGILNGNSGILLILTTFLHNDNSDWDQIFLI